MKAILREEESIMSGTPNLLVHETSPYLLQHAYNPVQWYPWGKEALSRAVAEDKPILVSIGYAACHWCHVMERESFEDDATAQFMNAHFINIKIDREERPDLDHIYMDAVQAMTGSGGWPLNVFLTPAAKPFYGGTYFPPVKAFNRASWMDVMQGVVQAFTQKRHEIDAQAENLTDHLVQSNAFGLQKGAAAEGLYSKEKMKEAVDAVLKTADTVWGGFGKAPKFPQTATIQFLLRYHYTVALDTEKAASGEAALAQALLSLDKMIEGGIYDQAGGGFSRYATDTEWLAPHFEKMLYDNALLVGVLSEAYQLTGKQRYKEVIDETMAFVQREMQHPQKGFYAALDADSEGVEGKFYTWSLEEVQELLGEDAAVFCHYYDVTEKGNWEHSNILRVKKTPEVFAAAHGVGIEPLLEIIAAGRKKLMARRNERIRPQLDDKILLGWNALMNAACSKAFAATGREAYRQLAIENMQFLLDTFSLPGGEGLYHTWKNGQARYPAFLDDYAFLIQALLQLQEITADHAWLEKARELTRFVTENFSEQETGFFFYTAEGQEDIIVRKKEVYDGATPSGNAVMAGNLYRLGVLYDQAEWKERASGMLLSLGQAILRYPTSFGCWISLALELTVGTAEIAVVGKNYQSLYEEIISRYIPHRVLMGAGQEEKEYPLLVGKSVNSPALVYLCKDYACLQPVNSAEALITLIDSSRKA